MADGLALFGIISLVAVTAQGIENANREREIQALQSPGAGSASAPAAAEAGEHSLPSQTAANKADVVAELRGPKAPTPEVEQKIEVPEQDQLLLRSGVKDVGKSDSAPPVAAPASNAGDPFAPSRGGSSAASTSDDLIAARSELQKVSSQIEGERQRWKDALAVLNELTANKTRPVREGSPAYHRCMEASKIIQDVEGSAQDLKARKAQLEARIKKLEG